jgi:hypothetical protein
MQSRSSPGIDVQLYAFFNLALDKGEWPVPWPNHYTPGEIDPDTQ